MDKFTETYLRIITESQRPFHEILKDIENGVNPLEMSVTDQEDLAYCVNTPKEVYKTLATSDDRNVQHALISSGHLPDELVLDWFEKLPKEDYKRHYLAEDPRLPLDVIKQHLEDSSEDEIVKGYLIRNSNVPTEMLEEYATSDNINIRSGILLNKNCTRELVEKLTHDNNQVVRTNALNTYWKSLKRRR